MKSTATSILALVSAFALTSAIPISADDINLVGREVDPPPECTTTVTQLLVGDGAPQQIFQQTQVSTNVDCNGATCSAGASQSKTYTIGFSLGADPGEDSFLSFGFDVSESFTTGTAETCTLSNSPDTVCIWWNVPMTGYQVVDQSYNSCTREYTNSTTYTMTAPNINDPRNKQYCETDASCVQQGFVVTPPCSCEGPPGTLCACGEGF